MDMINLYGQLLANAALLPDPKKETQIIYRRLIIDQAYFFIKSKKFLAVGSEDKARIDELNFLNRRVDRLEYDKKIMYGIIHKTVKS